MEPILVSQRIMELLMCQCLHQMGMPLLSQPQSTMCPTVVTHNSDNDGRQKVRLVVGAAGGSKIISSVALTTILNIMKDLEVDQSVETPRIHHQLWPMLVEYENKSGFYQDIISFLKSVGHETLSISSAGSSVGAVARRSNGGIMAAADTRKSGGVAGSNTSGASILTFNLNVQFILLFIFWSFLNVSVWRTST